MANEQGSLLVRVCVCVGGGGGHEYGDETRRSRCACVARRRSDAGLGGGASQQLASCRMFSKEADRRSSLPIVLLRGRGDFVAEDGRPDVLLPRRNVNGVAGRASLTLSAERLTPHGTPSVRMCIATAGSIARVSTCSSSHSRTTVDREVPGGHCMRMHVQNARVVCERATYLKVNGCAKRKSWA
jgi:hypothetical protein